MTNDSLLRILSLVLENRTLINSIIDDLDEEQLKKGILVISESTLNIKLRPMILSLSPMIKDYSVRFDNDSILLDGVVNIPKIGGSVNLKYFLRLQELLFGANGHRITFDYMEDARGENAMINMALSAFKLKSTLAARATSLIKKYKDAIYVTEKMIAVDLDGFDIKEKLPSELNLSYLGASDGKIRLKFWLS